MPNVTIAVDEATLRAGREYARNHNTSLNRMLRSFLAQVSSGSSSDWLNECFALMDRTKAAARGKRWKREELYDV